MSDSKTFKVIIVAFLAVLVAHFYPELKSLVYKNFDYLQPIGQSDSSVLSQRESVEREIIQSWASLIRPPNRNINRSLKIAIGYFFDVVLLSTNTTENLIYVTIEKNKA
jgi:hypothetical protein